MLFNKHVMCRGIWLEAIHLILSRQSWADPLSQIGIGNLVLIKIIKDSSSRFPSLWGRSNKIKDYLSCPSKVPVQNCFKGHSMRYNLKNNSFSTFIGSTPDIEINLICLIYTVNLRIKRFMFYNLYVTFCCFHSTNLLFTLPNLHYYNVHDRLMGVITKTIIHHLFTNISCYTEHFLSILTICKNSLVRNCINYLFWFYEI